jgi:hypothetical protein
MVGFNPITKTIRHHPFGRYLIVLWYISLHRYTMTYGGTGDRITDKNAMVLKYMTVLSCPG